MNVFQKETLCKHLLSQLMSISFLSCTAVVVVAVVVHQQHLIIVSLCFLSLQLPKNISIVQDYG